MFKSDTGVPRKNATLKLINSLFLRIMCLAEFRRIFPLEYRLNLPRNAVEFQLEFRSAVFRHFDGIPDGFRVPRFRRQ